MAATILLGFSIVYKNAVQIGAKNADFQGFCTFTQD